MVEHRPRGYRREKVANELRIHCVDGRITVEELDQRLQTAMSAVTIGELAVVVYDLPTIAAVVLFFPLGLLALLGGRKSHRIVISLEDRGAKKTDMASTGQRLAVYASNSLN